MVGKRPYSQLAREFAGRWESPRSRRIRRLLSLHIMAILPAVRGRIPTSRTVTRCGVVGSGWLFPLARRPGGRGPPATGRVRCCGLSSWPMSADSVASDELGRDVKTAGNSSSRPSWPAACWPTWRCSRFASPKWGKLSRNCESTEITVSTSTFGGDLRRQAPGRPWRAILPDPAGNVSWRRDGIEGLSCQSVITVRLYAKKYHAAIFNGKV